MAGSSFTGPLKIKKSDGSKVTFVNASGDLVDGTEIVFGNGDTLDDTNGNEVLEVTVTASAVNHLGVVNSATGDNPILRAEGEANTGITFDNSEGEEILILNSNATSVNELTVSSAATGSDPTIAATGDDTNINVALTPKGTGNVKATTGGFEHPVETVTAASPTLAVYGATQIDSSSNAVDGTLGSGTFVGQLKTIVMTEASNSSTVSITNHETSDPEVATFDAVDEYWLGIWTGTEWATVANTCTFV